VMRRREDRQRKRSNQQASTSVTQNKNPSLLPQSP
jgi:hypothetical protein